MEQVDAEALDALKAALAGFVPPPAGPLLRADLSVLPVRFSPSGLGNFIGPNESPAGAIVGRRLQAHVLLMAVAPDHHQLDGAVPVVTSGVLAADPAALRRAGILSIALDDLGPRLPSQDAGDT